MYNKIYDFMYRAVISSITAYKGRDINTLIKESFKVFAFLAVIALVIAILCVIALNLYMLYLSQLLAVRWMIKIAIAVFIVPMLITLIRKKD